MALDNISQILSAGFEEGQLALLNSDGYPMGLAGTLSAGSSVGLYAVKGVRAANVSIPGVEKTTVQGNNRALGTFLWPPGDLPEFDLDVAVADMDLAAALEGVKARDLDKWTLHPVGAQDLTYQDAMLLLSTEAQSQESGSDGLSLWYNLLLPKVKLAYVGPQGLNMRGENIFRFHVIVRPADTFPWGEALTLTDDGTVKAPIFEWITEYRVSMDTISLEAATAQITLAYTQAMDDPSDDNGILFYVDGVDTAMLTSVPSTKVVTFTPIGSAAMGVFVYERAD